MRILNSISLHGWSAGSWYAVEMMRGLVERGHEIHMLVPEGHTAEAAGQTGITVHNDPDLRSLRPSEWKGTLARLRKLRDDSIRPDIVLAHWGPDHTWWGLLQKNRTDPFPLVRVRTVDPRRPSRHPISRWLHRRRTAAFIVSNETQRKAYLKYHRLRPDRVFRIPPGFDTDSWDSREGEISVRRHCGVGDDTLLISSIARFAPQKDHTTFFTAADLLSRRVENVHFLVAGYPAEFDVPCIEEIASRYPGLKGKYTLWTERLPYGGSMVKSVDIGVIHSSGSEAICRVAMEYMASRIPLIATRVGSLGEVIHDGMGGMLVPPGKPGALAGALYRLVENGQLRVRLGENGRRRLEDVFSFRTAVSRLENALEQIIRQG